MTDRSMRRREFLRGLGAATLSGIALPSMGCAASDPLTAALAGFFSDREAARAVGSAYLAATPGEGSAQVLIDRLAGPQRADWEAVAARDPGALYTELRSHHRDDFARGDVISLGGWVLSRTEARLCALGAL